MIGLYDSGVGGLSVLRRLWVHLPDVPVAYVADSARAPYGTRTQAELARFGSQIARFLQGQGARLLVVACNTSSAVALEAVRAAFAGPVVAMLGPAAGEVAGVASGRAGRPARIGVLATPTTVASGAYSRLLEQAVPGACVVEQPCPRWVPLIEAGVLEGPQAEACVEEDVGSLLRAGVDLVVLGCTHYPFWRALVERRLGGRVALVDPADAVAREVARVARELGLPGGGQAPAADGRFPERASGGPAGGCVDPGQGYDIFFTSGGRRHFFSLFRRLVGREHALSGRSMAGVCAVRWDEAARFSEGACGSGSPVAAHSPGDMHPGLAGSRRGQAPSGGGARPDPGPSLPAGGELPRDWRGVRVAVVGLGAENLPLVRFLVARGARVVACDRKGAEALGERAVQLEALGARLALGPGYLDVLADVEVAFLTPGIPKHLEPIRAARAAGVRITGQMDLFLRLCRAPVVGVTGSAGKTTTTTLIGQMLQGTGRPVWVGGNIGLPLIERVEEIGPDAWVVLELSSFQLETLSVSPHGAVVTNVSPNHLDVHESMAAYVAAKERIVAFQKPGDFAVLNGDDPVVAGMARLTPAQVLWFSMTGPRLPGAWLEGDRLLACVGPPAAAVGRNGAAEAASAGLSGEPAGPAHPATGPGTAPGPGDGFGPGRPPGEEVCRRSDVRLRGEHNLANVLAAAAVALRCGVPPRAVREVVGTFTGVPHRLEEVGWLDGVLYVNDSIATTPARALAGLAAFQEPVVLIAGGYDKHLPFDDFARQALQRCRHVVLLGQTAPAIRRALEQAAAELARCGLSLPTITHAATFEEGVRQARQAARPGDVVLLSPACASYDMFRNFEERGARFRELVRAMEQEAVRRGG